MGALGLGMMATFSKKKFAYDLGFGILALATLADAFNQKFCI